MDISKIKRYQIISAIFVCISGTLLHFTYKIFGENKFVASFSAVNESVWEHLKLLFFPMLLTTIIGYFYIGKSHSNFLCSKAIGIITAIFFIVVFLDGMDSFFLFFFWKMADMYCTFYFFLTFTLVISC